MLGILLVNLLIQTIITFFVYFICIYVIYVWITIMGYIKHERITINMLYSLKKFFCPIPPLPPHNGQGRSQLIDL